MTEKISVIVPVYKVEPYLRKCLDSILAQTYANLEIILVDDGSPDGCGAICDEYAALDERIIVIHQQNAGLSAARNAALDIATGDYIGFVDSDDWIEPDMYEYLLTGLLDNGADIAVCGSFIELIDGQCRLNHISPRLLSGRDALRPLLEDDEIHNSAWDKLYSRRMFDGIRFPVSRTYEDVATTYKCFERAKLILCLPEPKYHYIHRMGSIISDLSLSGLMNFHEAISLRYDDLAPRYPEFQPLLDEKLILSAISPWTVYLSAPRTQRSYYLPQLKKLAKFASTHSVRPKLYSNLGLAGKLILQALPHASFPSFVLAWSLGKIYYLSHGEHLK